MDRVKLHFQQTAEFARKVDRDPSVNRPLLVEESLGSGKSEDPFVPNVRVDVKPVGSGKSKADELLGSDIVAGQG